jgi:transcriptional regulator with XRE-family HTH domain
MGRPTKDANHPLVRLRRVLSTPSDEVTRKDLAKRTGIPETSLRDIETGRYKITPEVATTIAYATGVDPRSLLAGDDPLLDHRGQPLSKDTPGAPRYYWWLRETQEVRRQLFSALLDAAEEKKIVSLIHFNFENWLEAMIKAFGLEDLFAEKLMERLTLFDPYLVPHKFRPKNKDQDREWWDFDLQILKEFMSILDDHKIYPQLWGGAWAERDALALRGTWANPFSTLPPDTTKAEQLAWFKDEQKLTELYTQARERAARKLKEGAAKPATIKPLSGKRPRSPGRPAA